MKKLAVILPTYNGAEYVRISVESVLNQTYGDFEFLICDDASDDGTWQYLQSLTDPRIKLFRNGHNKGLFPTLNFLIHQAQAQWIHLWSQDDVMYPFCLEEEVRFIDRHPDVPFFFCQRDIIDSQGKIIEKFDKKWDNELISTSHLVRVSILAGSITGNIATTVVKKSEVERVGYFDESLHYSADFDMWERLSRGHSNIGVINKALIQLREHESQLSKQMHMKIYQLKENQQIIKHFLERLQQSKLRKKAIRGIKWKINVMYCLWGIKMLITGQVKTAGPYFRQLAQTDNLPMLLLRCFITKMLDMARLKQKFYYLLFYKGYYDND